MEDRNLKREKQGLNLLGLFRKPEDGYFKLLEEKLNVSEKLENQRAKSCDMKRVNLRNHLMSCGYAYDHVIIENWNGCDDVCDFSREDIKYADEEVEKLLVKWLKSDKEIKEAKEGIKSEDLKRIQADSILSRLENYNKLFEYVGLRVYKNEILDAITITKAYINGDKRRSDDKQVLLKMPKGSFNFEHELSLIPMNIRNNFNDVFVKVIFRNNYYNKMDIFNKDIMDNDLENKEKMMSLLTDESKHVDSMLKKISLDKDMIKKAEKMIFKCEAIPLDSLI